MTTRHAGTAATLLTLAATATASTAAAAATPPPFDPTDEEAVRQARAFQRLVLENRPDVVALPAQSDVTIDFGRGPIPVHVPASYDPETPAPLIILLHGYTSSGPAVEAWMQLSQLVDEYGFLYVYPTGTSDFFGLPFWNATDACCDLTGGNPDDSGYLRGIVDVMSATYNVDPRRIHFAGHSNGGFMSYRMACDHADVVASVASFAGATFLDASDCTPSEPVHALQIHGTADGVIAYGGGCIPFGGCYPGAVQTTETWAAYGGCAPVGETLPEQLDLDAGIPGEDTTVTRYDTGCDAGGSAELWTIDGGVHSPVLSPDFSRLMVEFLLAHPKPSACPADVNGSGAVDFDDLVAVLASWGPCDGCPADIDGDGLVGLDDVLATLSAWGACEAP